MNWFVSQENKASFFLDKWQLKAWLKPHALFLGMLCFPLTLSVDHRFFLSKIPVFPSDGGLPWAHAFPSLLPWVVGLGLLLAFGPLKTLLRFVTGVIDSPKGTSEGLKKTTDLLGFFALLFPQILAFLCSGSGAFAFWGLCFYALSVRVLFPGTPPSLDAVLGAATYTRSQLRRSFAPPSRTVPHLKSLCLVWGGGFLGVWIALSLLLSHTPLSPFWANAAMSAFFWNWNWAVVFHLAQFRTPNHKV